MFKKKKNTKSNVSEQPRRVYSYYSATSKSLSNNERQVTSKELKKEPRKRYFRGILKNWFYLLVGIILAVMFIFSLKLNTPAKVIINGPQYRSSEQYQQIVDSSIKSSWFNNFKPLVDKESVISIIKDNLPEVGSVEIKSPVFASHPQVMLKTDSALAIFSENEIKYALSNNGRVLLLVGDDSQISTLPKIINNSSVRAEEGAQFISPGQAEAIRMIIYQFTANGGNISNLSFEIPIQPNELLMRDQSRGNYYVRFLLDSETINQQFGSYLAVVSKLSNNSPRQYIDARLAEKIFVN